MASEDVIAVLSDPMSLPPAFKDWVIKYVEANPPSLPIGGMSGYIQPTKITTGSFSAGPPADAKDGDIWIGTGVDSHGTRWQFQYNANSTAGSKWEFIGGPPVLISSTTVPSSWTVAAWDIFTATIWAAARDGDYLVDGMWSGESPVAGGTQTEQAGVSFNNGTGFPSPTLLAQTSTPSAATSEFQVQSPETLVSMKATNKVALGYRTSATPNNFFVCSISIIPVRIT